MRFRQDVFYLVLRALDAGAVQTAPFEFEWDVAGDCLSPVRRDVAANKPSQPLRKTVFKVSDDWATSPFPYDWVPRREVHEYGVARYGPHVIHMSVRCRMCQKCLEARSKVWAARACAEFPFAARTWLITLTLRPDQHHFFADKARLRCRARRGEEFDSLSHEEQFRLRHDMVQPEITKMLKRWRKAGFQFRYLLVVEAHTGKGPDGELGANFGLPHYHMLLHEWGKPLPKREIEAGWPHGFVGAKLATKDAAFYVAKYLAKTRAARVRASSLYGRPGQSALAVEKRKCAFRDLVAGMPSLPGALAHGAPGGPPVVGPGAPLAGGDPAQQGTPAQKDQ